MYLKPTFLLSLTLLAPCSGAGGDSAAPSAKTLTEVRSEAADPFKLVRVEGSPASFVAEWTQQMPTPNWTFVLDDLSIEGDRIVARVTEVRPEGMVVQMVAPGTMKIPLGTLARGRYVFEIRHRRDKTRDHRPAFATVLQAI